VADTVQPLCSAAQLTEGAFADLFREYSTQAVSDLLIEATRECESETGRRLAPFTGVTETHRASAMDPDEYTDSANIPMDIQGTLGRSYAAALGVTTLVRHVWLNEYAVRYPDLWTSSVSQLTIVRSYGGTENLSSFQYVGPEADSGHVWFNLGLFIPIGSLARITYGGGYTVATPADLSRACKLMAAWMAVTELNPESTSHDPDQLHTAAMMLLGNYLRS
jgi:hypothetical protein